MIWILRQLLTGAFLEGADLTGTYLKGANFSGADLEEADFTKVDLREDDDLILKDLEAHNLKIDQLSKVKILHGAKLDDKLRIPLENEHPELFEVPKPHVSEDLEW